MERLKILSDEEVEKLHQAAVRILGEVGIELSHPGARQLLLDAGCGKKGSRLILPPELVGHSIKKCPEQVNIYGRNGSRLTLGDGSLYFHNLGGARDLYDVTSGEHRYAVLQDVRDSTRLLDALPNCTSVTPFFTPIDVPGELMSLSMYRHALPFTTKPLQGPGVQNAAEVRYTTRMASVISPPDKFLTLSVSPISPLAFPDRAVEAILEIARSGITFAPLPCPTAGTTAPISLAGGVAQQAAEVLASVVLVQLVKPGLPVIFCGRLAVMEPRTGNSVWGGVEIGLASAATVQLGHYYKLPVNVYGFSTNAHNLDVQNGFERALNAVIPALAGADELSGIGEMEAGALSTYTQMVADDEFAAVIQRARRGFTADEDSLAVDVIARVMDGPRNFLSQTHTIRYLKGGELFFPAFAERGSWETWEKGGRLGLAERARDEAERILREHQVEPLEQYQIKELDALMASAEKELVNH